MPATTATHDRLEEGSPSVTWVTVAASGPGYTAATHRSGSAPYFTAW